MQKYKYYLLTNKPKDESFVILKRLIFHITTIIKKLQHSKTQKVLQFVAVATDLGSF